VRVKRFAGRYRPHPNPLPQEREYVVRPTVDCRLLTAKEHTLRYHLIGIGGVGMSAIAFILHKHGHLVSGSDRQESDITRRLRESGIDVHIGHDSANLGHPDVVVYSAAIGNDNPELAAAHARGIPILERPAMLGKLMEPYRHRVAVTGTHGKTTTTSMLHTMLAQAGLDPTTLIGGDLKSLGGNVRIGDGSIVVAEACEAYESFLHLHPTLAVITNIEADHLDHYGNVERVENAFRQFAGQVDADGCIVANLGDERLRGVLEGCERAVVWFGVEMDADLSARDVDIRSPRASYTMQRSGRTLGRVTLDVPGMHNLIDSLAAAGAAFELGADFESIATGLEGFSGADRRFDILREGEIMVVDDYAHHPTEVRATLDSARAAYPDRRIVAVFQPHLYSRTSDFAQEFAQALSIADEVWLAPIYAAREQPVEGVTSRLIADRMPGASSVVVEDMGSISRALMLSLRPGDLVLVMGAGDIRAVAEELAERLGSEAGL